MDKIKQIKRLFLYECRQTIISKSYQFLIPALVALQGCFVSLNMWKEELTTPVLYSSFLEGMQQISGMLLGPERFLIPGDWCVFVFFFLYIIGRNAKNYTAGTGLQLLLRTERVENIWYVKCFTSLIQAILYFGTAYFVILLFIIWKYGISAEALLPMEEFLKQFLIPVITAWTIAVWQMIISMKINTIFGVIFMVGLVVSSAYAQKWYLIGNYLMKLRVTELIDSGFSYGKILIFLMILLVTGIIVGNILIRQIDYLRAKGDL